MELLVGLVEDPVFGPLVAFGQGGTAVEIVRDTSLELPPLNALLARRLMARTRVWQLLQGYRGKPPANIEAVVDVLIRLGQLAADHPEIRELDINPLLADALASSPSMPGCASRRLKSTGCCTAGHRALSASISKPSNSCATGRHFECDRCARRTSRCCTTSLRI